MKYCPDCGNKLVLKELKSEGLVPFCSLCNTYKFDFAYLAVSLIIVNQNLNKTLLVKQYNTNKFRLVAGYVNKGESAEEALVREMKEEINIAPMSYSPLKTMYYEKNNTLLINYVVYVNTIDINPNYEIDDYAWVNIEDAIELLKDSKYAHQFYLNYLIQKNLNAL